MRIHSLTKQRTARSAGQQAGPPAGSERAGQRALPVLLRARACACSCASSGRHNPSGQLPCFLPCCAWERSSVPCSLCCHRLELLEQAAEFDLVPSGVGSDNCLWPSAAEMTLARRLGHLPLLSAPQALATHACQASQVAVFNPSVTARIQPAVAYEVLPSAPFCLPRPGTSRALSYKAAFASVL